MTWVARCYSRGACNFILVKHQLISHLEANSNMNNHRYKDRHINFFYSPVKGVTSCLLCFPYLISYDHYLFLQFDFIKNQGTCIIIYNLWEDDEGKLELDFETDPEVWYSTSLILLNTPLLFYFYFNRIFCGQLMMAGHSNSRSESR